MSTSKAQKKDAGKEAEMEMAEMSNTWYEKTARPYIYTP